MANWTIDTTIANDDSSVWKNPLVSPTSASFLKVSEAVEDILVDPENMTLEPETIQSDDEEWTVLPEPD